MGSTPAGREDARIEEVDGRRGSDSQSAEPPLSKRPPPEPSQPTRRWLGSHRPPKRDKALTSEKPPRFRGVPEDFFRKRESPFMPDCSLKREEDRCEEDCRENCLAGPLWAEELEYGGRRGGLKMWLKQGQVTSHRASSLHRQSREKRACLEERVREQVLLLRVGD